MGEQVATGRSDPRMRIVTRLLLVAVLATVLVPVGPIEAWSTPVTLSETLDGLPVDDAPGLDIARDATEHGTGEEQPSVLPSELVEAPLAFSALGVTAPPGVTSVAVRTSADGTSWDQWEPLEFIDASDGPDEGSAEDRATPAGQHTEPLWVGEATHLQVQVEGGSPEDLEVTLIDSMRLNGGPVERHVASGDSADASGLDIVSRARWGADESLGSSTRTASRVHMGVVHHTAHRTGSAANTYSRDEAPGLMRAMHRYHTVTLGWADLGYNVVVDRYGTIYEGRKGGFNNGVIGAHASGFNTGSFGVAVIGNFVDEQAPAAAIRSLTRVIATKSAIHGIDPGATTTRMGDGRVRPTIVGHRDVGQTSCPGRIHDLLPRIRSDARADAVRFPDVPATSPHRSAIIELAEAGVTSGCDVNAFCPELGLNRAQASTFVVQALGLDPIPGSRFPDVNSGNVHAGAINVLAQEGWLIGYPDGRFRPWEPLTRAQLATLLARAIDEPLVTPASDPYPDVSRTDVHAPGIAALAAVGVRGNCGSGRFCPQDIARRDSTASFVHMARGVLATASVNLAVDQSVVYEGEPVDEQPVTSTRVRLDLLNPDSTVTASARQLGPGDEVVLGDEDGLQPGVRYELAAQFEPLTVPSSHAGCTLTDSQVTAAPDDTVVPEVDQPPLVNLEVDLTYSCA